MPDKSLFENNVAQCNNSIANQDWSSVLKDAIGLRVEFPERPYGFIWQSIAEWHLGNQEESDRISNEAVTLFPHRPWVWENRAQLATLRKDWKLSALLWLECTQRFPNSANTYTEGAKALMQAGSLTKAQDLLDLACERDLENLNIMIAQANLFEAQRDWQNALKQWEKIRQNHPNNAASYRRASNILKKDNNHVGAATLMIQWISRANNVLWRDYNEAAESFIRGFYDLDPEDARTTDLLRILINQPLNPNKAEEVSAILRFVRPLFTEDPTKFQTFSTFFENHFQTEWQIPFSKERSFALAIGLGSLRLEDHEISRLISTTTLAEFCRYFSNYPIHQSNVKALKVFISRQNSQELIGSLSKGGLKNLHIFGAAEGFANRPLFRDIAQHINRRHIRQQHVAPLVGRNRLRIAVCISGQLRGYKSAFSTWNRLGLEQHDAHYFVHGWKAIGQKYPAPANLARLYSGNFLNAFRKATSSYGFKHIELQFPSLFLRYQKSGIADKLEVKKLYGAHKVVLEDDHSSIFSTFTNPMKMFYKIQKSWDIARETGLNFDLVLRIRPDKPINPGEKVDWTNIYNECAKNPIIYTDVCFRLNPDINLFVGDQFAVSTPDLMDTYSQIYSRSLGENGNIRDRSEFSRVHRKLAFTLYDAGITALKMPSLNLGPPLDPEKLDSSTILALIQKDIKLRNKTSLDDLFLSALKADNQTIQ